MLILSEGVSSVYVYSVGEGDSVILRKSQFIARYIKTNSCIFHLPVHPTVGLGLEKMFTFDFELLSNQVCIYN